MKLQIRQHQQQNRFIEGCAQPKNDYDCADIPLKRHLLFPAKMNQVKEAKQMASKQKKRHEDKLILSKFFGKNIVKGTFDQVQDISQAIEYHK